MNSFTCFYLFVHATKHDPNHSWVIQKCFYIPKRWRRRSRREIDVCWQKRTHAGRQKWKNYDLKRPDPGDLYALLCHSGRGLTKALGGFRNRAWKKGWIISELGTFMIDLFIVPGECLWFPWQLPWFSLWENNFRLVKFKLSHGYAKLFKFFLNWRFSLSFSFCLC